MSVQVKGSGTIGGLDEGLVISGIVTSSTQINVGSNIKLGNAGVVTATSFVGSGANLTSLPAQATIANNADNRVITGGSGVNLNAESNVLYDGTNFGIGKSPSRTLDVQGKIRSSDSVCFGDNSSTPSEGAAIHRPAASTLAFVTNNTERLRITSTGNFGFATSSPVAQTDSSGTALTPVVDLKGTGSIANESGVLTLTRKDNATQGSMIYNSGDDAGLTMRNTDGNGMGFYNGTILALRVDSNGRFTALGNKPSSNAQMLQNTSSTNPEGVYIRFPNASPNSSSRHALKFSDSAGDKAVIGEAVKDTLENTMFSPEMGQLLEDFGAYVYQSFFLKLPLQQMAMNRNELVADRSKEDDARIRFEEMTDDERRKFQEEFKSNDQYRYEHDWFSILSKESGVGMTSSAGFVPAIRNITYGEKPPCERCNDKTTPCGCDD